jgi:hypothetical protein
MPFGAKRYAFSVGKEILKFASGLEAIESVVLAADEGANTSAALTSATTGQTGKLGLLAGTIIARTSGGKYRRYTNSGGETIVGVLTDNVYFYDATEASNEPAAIFTHTAVFNKAKIIDYNAYKTALEAALHTCRFESHYDSDGDVVS